jgi:hypothetical protein
MDVDGPIKSANVECNTLLEQSIKVRDQNVTRERQASSEKPRDQKATRCNDTANACIPIDTVVEGSDQPQDENLDNERTLERATELVVEVNQTAENHDQETDTQTSSNSDEADLNSDIALDTMNISELPATELQNDEEEQDDDSSETPTISCKEEPAIDHSDVQPASDEPEMQPDSENCAGNVVTDIEHQVDDQIDEDHVSPCESSSDSDDESGNVEAKPQIKEEYHDYHSLLFEVLNTKPKVPEAKAPVVNIELSTNILSYERFYPGRILGNTFCVKNTGDAQAKLKLNFENNSIDRIQVGEKLCDYFGEFNSSFTLLTNFDV